MAINGARLSRLEERLLSGLPLHKAAHLWSEAEIERFCAPGGAALVPTEDLLRLEAEVLALCLEEGIEPDELPEPVPASTAAGIATSTHGRLPMASRCGCGVCEDWRHANDIEEPQEIVEAKRMSVRLREVTNAHRATLGLDPLPIPEHYRRLVGEG